MNFDDFEFDEDGLTILGSFWDYMSSQETQDERLRRKLEEEMLNPDDCELEDDDEPEP